MATNTWVALDTKTLGSNVASVSFTGIDQTYTDLVLEISNACSTINGYGFTFGINGDTGNNYSGNGMAGDGSTTKSGFRYSNTFGSTWVGGWVAGMSNSTNLPSQAAIRFFNYTSTSMYKTVLGEYYSSAKSVESSVWTWRGSTGSAYQAINRIDIISQLGGANLAAGMILTLYGVKAEGISPAPKATGGAIYSDSLYYYHVFGSTGTFTPLSSLSADVMVVAGGGGGGYAQAGGGGAGGLRVLTSQSLSTSTVYTATIGAGGNGSSTNAVAGSNGSTSSFAGSGLTTINCTGGGGGGSYGNNTVALGLSGGSGGGAGTNANGSYAGGAGNAGSYSPVEGYAGGTGYTDDATYRASGGGGGAGGVGGSGNSSTKINGAGGVGSSAYSSWVLATGVGQVLSGTGYIAGGGGAGAGSAGQLGGYGGGGQGGSSGNPINYSVAGQTNTGSGGGGGSAGSQINGAAGGSGVVIVRYLKA